jgi:hypothetical protein
MTYNGELSRIEEVVLPRKKERRSLQKIKKKRIKEKNNKFLVQTFQVDVLSFLSNVEER